MGLIVFILFVLGCFLYVLPIRIAGKRNHPRAVAIFKWNFLAGWTVVGWVVALVWSCSAISSPSRGPRWPRPSGTGTLHRVISRVGQFGPLDSNAIRTYPELAQFEQFGPTEADLIGARNVYPYSGVADWICTAEDHWLFAGTGMKNGEGIPSLVGFEWMGAPANIPGLEVVAKGPIALGGVKRDYTATIYPGPKNNVVFNAATIWWADGLSAPPGYKTPCAQGAMPKGPDARVQKITGNLFQRMRGA